MKYNRTPPAFQAFTVIELVVVIAMVAVLFSLLLPALASSQLRSRTAGCIDNQRQLVLGWRMYAEDNSDQIIGMTDTTGCWRVRPDLFGASLPATNAQDAAVKCDELGYQRGGLYRYAQNPRAIHCPADARVRQSTAPAYCSYSGAGGLNKNGIGLQSYALGKVNDVQHPSARWVWIEENDPRTIVVGGGWTIADNRGSWDPNLSVDLQQVAQTNYSTCKWTDTPGAFHFNSTVFAYADGHSAAHRWLDDATFWIATYAGTDKPVQAFSVQLTTGGPNGLGSPNDLPFVFSTYATTYNP